MKFLRKFQKKSSLIKKYFIVKKNKSNIKKQKIKYVTNYIFK